MTTHSSILAQRIPWTEERGKLQSKGMQSWKGFLGSSTDKEAPAIQETQVQFLSQKVPLEKGQATHSSILGLPLVGQTVKNPPAVQEIWV